MASRSSISSSRIRSKTSEFSDLFRGRQPPAPTSAPTHDPAAKPKRRIPLFSLRKKSPAVPPTQRSPTPTPVPTPGPPTNPSAPLSVEFARDGTHLPHLSIPPFTRPKDDSPSPQPSSSPTTSRSTRSVTRTSSSRTPSSLISKSRTPTPTSAITLGGSFSDSEPSRSTGIRTPIAAPSRSYASDDDERRYLSTRNIPPSKPAPTKSLPPPPEQSPSTADAAVSTLPTSLRVNFPTPQGTYLSPSSEAKLATPGVRKTAVSMPRARPLRLAIGSESAPESAQGYTSASGSESATSPSLGLGFRIRTRSGRGNEIGSASVSRAASVRVGLLRAPISVTGTKTASAPSSKSSAASPTASSLRQPQHLNSHRFRIQPHHTSRLLSEQARPSRIPRHRSPSPRP
ncbi:hypothetical protein BC834DRAFT_76941 [Gloeopeniophorella convolvens]|nr:hypothetical protein BC834DRAFT_76941 [Gloeopeniophorella convolvens]